MFRAVPLPIIRSFPLYIRNWYMSSRFDDIYQCRMYSGKLLMMGRGTARNMLEFLDKNKFGKLVRLLVLLKRNLLRCRSQERKIHTTFRDLLLLRFSDNCVSY